MLLAPGLPGPPCLSDGLIVERCQSLSRLVLRPGAAHGYCVGLITPAILAGPIAVRSTQFGGGISRIVRVLRRKQWVEDLRYILAPQVFLG